MRLHLHQRFLPRLQSLHARDADSVAANRPRPTQRRRRRAVNPSAIRTKETGNLTLRRLSIIADGFSGAAIARIFGQRHFFSRHGLAINDRKSNLIVTPEESGSSPAA